MSVGCYGCRWVLCLPVGVMPIGRSPESARLSVGVTPVGGCYVGGCYACRWVLCWWVSARLCSVGAVTCWWSPCSWAGRSWAEWRRLAPASHAPTCAATRHPAPRCGPDGSSGIPSDSHPTRPHIPSVAAASHTPALCRCRGHRPPPRYPGVCYLVGRGQPADSFPTPPAPVPRCMLPGRAWSAGRPFPHSLGPSTPVYVTWSGVANRPTVSPFPPPRYPGVCYLVGRGRLVNRFIQVGDEILHERHQAAAALRQIGGLAVGGRQSLQGRQAQTGQKGSTHTAESLYISHKHVARASVW